MLQMERSSMPISQRQATGVDTRRYSFFDISWMERIVGICICIHDEIGITSWISLMEYFVGGLECHHPN